MSLLGKRILISGHTGFKGAWLARTLELQGAIILGVSNVADQQHKIHNGFKNYSKVQSIFLDICDYDKIKSIVSDFRPELCFHLAAQPLVRASYKDPLETIRVNVLGTAAFLKACLESSVLRGVVAVTTDKVYKNMSWAWPYRETDVLGGYDPYSMSKASAELVIESFRQSFYADRCPVASVRAGNVIGGGDASPDRLIPDLIRASENDGRFFIRSPDATRPWQHVLDPISAYILIAERMLDGDATVGRSWNIGPQDGNEIRVIDVAHRFISAAKLEIDIVHERSSLHEASLLNVDSRLIRSLLHWKELMSPYEAVDATAEWLLQTRAGNSVQSVTDSQIKKLYLQNIK